MHAEAATAVARASPVQARTAVSMGETVSIKAVLIKTVSISRGADISGKFRNGVRRVSPRRRVFHRDRTGSDPKTEPKPDLGRKLR